MKDLNTTNESSSIKTFQIEKSNKNVWNQTYRI